MKLASVFTLLCEADWRFKQVWRQRSEKFWAALILNELHADNQSCKSCKCPFSYHPAISHTSFFSASILFPSLFVCSHQPAGSDMAAEALRRPHVKQRTGSWSACQQWCGHTALWRQRYEQWSAHFTFILKWKSLKKESIPLNGKPKHS